MASRERDIRDVFRYENVEERKKMLARVLQFPEFNEEDDLKTAVLIDVYYELLSYLVNNGFPWREVASFFEIFQRLLNNSQGKDCRKWWQVVENTYRLNTSGNVLCDHVLAFKKR